MNLARQTLFELFLAPLDKKKKKKYNGSIMIEAVAPKERINLGGKSLGKILSLLGEHGWKTNPEALKFVDITTVMMNGDKQGAEFWHYPQPVIDEGRFIIRFAHKDDLTYDGNSLKRNCPTDGQETVSSAVVES